MSNDNYNDINELSPSHTSHSLSVRSKPRGLKRKETYLLQLLEKPRKISVRRTNEEVPRSRFTARVTSPRPCPLYIKTSMQQASGMFLPRRLIQPANHCADFRSRTFA